MNSSVSLAFAFILFDGLIFKNVLFEGDNETSYFTNVLNINYYVNKSLHSVLFTTHVK